LKNGGDQTTHFLATKEDVSQRKSLEEQLRHSQKLEAVGRLAGGVAHDFNNLLTVIIGYAEMAGSRLSSNDPLLADIQEVKKAGERASILVRQLLAFSRRQILQPVMLDLNQSVRDLDQMFPRLLGENITLKTYLSPEIAQVRADAGQMEQVIVNLAINSRDAMPKGGEFTIQTSNVDVGPDFAINQLQVNPGSYVLLAITDTGLGMTPETMARLFEPFFTTKERGKGTGLGLSTVYGIVRQSGGGIHVQSEPGKGTTFYVYLPRAMGAQIGSLPNIVDTDKPHGRMKVLVVEDESTVRKFTVETLSRNGYDVFGAGNSEEALRFCSDHDRRLDLLLTDIMLPGMNGHDLASRIHERWPGMKVLYMSGYSETTLDFNPAMDPGVDFIPKPFTPKGLLRKVQQVLSAASVPDAEASI
jgi:two-component system cell cycle sensor histidine kinase/response regulator CckA